MNHSITGEGLPELSPNAPCFPYANEGDTFFFADRIGSPHDISDQVFLAFFRNELAHLSSSDQRRVANRIEASSFWKLEVARVRALRPEECTDFDFLEDTDKAQEFWKRARERTI